MASDQSPGPEVTAEDPVLPDEPLAGRERDQRTADQVRAIVEALGGPDAVGVVSQAQRADGGVSEYEAKAGDYGEMVYMFQRGRILVRDVDLPRVAEVPIMREEGIHPVPDGINGLTTLEVRDTFAVLAAIDAELGSGAAFPDHVVHLTSGGKGSACPATEPHPPGRRTPWPTRDVHHCCDGSTALVALVDAGFDPLTAEQTEWLHGVCGDAETYDPDNIGPYTGHGTFAAGVVRQMAPGCAAYVHGFLAHGGAAFESELIVNGFAKALRSAPDIVSISAGTYTRDDNGMLGFRVAWEQFGTKGTVVVAAAGNDSDRKPFFPAADWYAVGVGALDVHGARASYTNFGSWVDCYAVGSQHVNAFPRGTYHYEQAPRRGQRARLPDGLAKWSGTSFATPLVAGVIAGRMTWSGESGRDAADAVLDLARKHAQPHVGAVVQPWMACRPGWRCG